MAKRFLDELRWHPKKSIQGVEIVYVHRGAPGDVMSIQAKSIIKFESSFFVIERNNIETRIPYHRIREIRIGSEVLWRRK
ncbi:MAG: DUF504 domain-containing protein [Euryarchaeota archaeon]|nr:DUF504 domain-containing protein [Euryarchaeota archaeon]